MRIAGLQKLTLLDFPGRTAATVFTPGCNLRCPFCHNGELVLGSGGAGGAPGSDDASTAPAASTAGAAAAAPGTPAAPAAPAAPGTPAVPAAGAAAAAPAAGDIPLTDVLAFLRKRQGLLDGVCITGGEPLLQPDIADFCRVVRELGFAVKLDTNGTLPDRLRALLDARLVDYVAMDVKNAPGRYAETVGCPSADLDAIQKSMKLLMMQDPAEGGASYEFRTTVVRELHTRENLVQLAYWIADDARELLSPVCPPWFIQSFADSDAVLGGSGAFHPWDADELRTLHLKLRTILPSAQLRGID